MNWLEKIMVLREENRVLDGGTRTAYSSDRNTSHD